MLHSVMEPVVELLAVSSPNAFCGPNVISNFQDSDLADNIGLFSYDQCTTSVLKDGQNYPEMMLGSYTITTTL